MKRWHLYIIITLCFILTFVGINFKYDRFYRVNGINNDNRALIEQYLDKNEQDYLVENAIPVNKFISYITIPEFKLENYEYYNDLKATKKYGDNRNIVIFGNNAVKLIKVKYSIDPKGRFDTLLKSDLIDAYVNNNENFDFDNIEYYQLMKINYPDNDYTYIDDTNFDVSTVEKLSDDDTLDIFKKLTKVYSKDSLKLLLNTKLDTGVQAILDLKPLTSIVNGKSYIASYEPSKLITIEGIKRIKYSIYLQSDAYNNLKEMYNALYKDISKRFIVEKGYESYSSTAIENNALAGHDEFQLGTSVKLRYNGLSSQDFAKSDLSLWLQQNSYKYGFILRYPSGKETLTGKAYDPTIYRYVGKDIAKKIYTKKICLEEYDEVK